MDFPITKPTKHEKTWGFESWIVNAEKYCSKLLTVEQNKYCSYHFHKIKDEHFQVLEGEFLVEMPDGNGGKQKIHLKAGEGLHVPPMTPHRFIGLAKINVILETSTTHFEDDSYRLEPAWGKDST